MLKVVSFKICPFVQRVTALLEAKNIAYEIEYISLKDKPRWFVEVSPHGQVPLLITESGRALFESDAIVEYLEEAYPRLMPELSPELSPEQRALDRAWSYLATKNYLVQCGALSSPDKATLNERSQKLEKAFTTVEQALGETPFFNTDSPGMVDIAWLPLLHRAAIVEQRSGYDFLTGYPQLKRWQQQLLATGLAEKSVAADFEQLFAAFYLSDETFLGHKGDVCSQSAGRAGASASCC